MVDRAQHPRAQQVSQFACVYAEFDDEPAGYAFFFDSYSTFQGRGLFLEDLFVRPQFRKNKIGGALLCRVEAIAREENCFGVMLHVLDWNETAIQFYKKMNATCAISHRETLFSMIFGGSSCQRFSASLQQALGDPSVSAVIIDIDSPGGTIDGVPELSSEIYNARGKKRIVAVANGMAASAAYWVGTAADELWVTPSGQVGSIGVFAAHEDISKALEMEGIKVSLISAGKYKTEGMPYEPLSAEARASMQQMVNTFGDLFINAVARNRGIGSYAVRNGFGEGRMVLAQDAVKAGMADQVATLDETLARLLTRRISKNDAAAARRERELELYM